MTVARELYQRQTMYDMIVTRKLYQRQTMCEYDSCCCLQAIPKSNNALYYIILYELNGWPHYRIRDIATSYEGGTERVSHECQK